MTAFELKDFRLDFADNPELYAALRSEKAVDGPIAPAISATLANFESDAREDVALILRQLALRILRTNGNSSAAAGGSQSSASRLASFGINLPGGTTVARQSSTTSARASEQPAAASNARPQSESMPGTQTRSEAGSYAPAVSLAGGSTASGGIPPFAPTNQNQRSGSLTQQGPSRSASSLGRHGSYRQPTTSEVADAALREAIERGYIPFPSHTKKSTITVTAPRGSQPQSRSGTVDSAQSRSLEPPPRPAPTPPTPSTMDMFRQPLPTSGVAMPGPAAEHFGQAVQQHPPALATHSRRVATHNPTLSALSPEGVEGLEQTPSSPTPLSALSHALTSYRFQKREFKGIYEPGSHYHSTEIAPYVYHLPKSTVWAKGAAPPAGPPPEVIGAAPITNTPWWAMGCGGQSGGWYTPPAPTHHAAANAHAAHRQHHPTHHMRPQHHQPPPSCSSRTHNTSGWGGHGPHGASPCAVPWWAGGHAPSVSGALLPTLKSVTMKGYYSVDEMKMQELKQSCPWWAESVGEGVCVYVVRCDVAAVDGGVGLWFGGWVFLLIFTAVLHRPVRPMKGRRVWRGRVR